MWGDEWKPAYDPDADEGNFPLVEWAVPTPLSVTYDAMRGWFVFQPVAGQSLPYRNVLDTGTLRWIAGLKPFARPGAFEQSMESAAIRYFRETQFLETLTPAAGGS